MITTKNNFKGYLRRHYPEITAYPIYGLPIYILDKPLNDMDSYTYNVQPLPNGKYAAFIGTTIAEATKLMAEIHKNGVPRNSHTIEKRTAPTTFSSFEAWLERHKIVPINRTFCNNMSPEECFHSEHIEGCSAPQKKGVWYMYELPGYADDGERFVNIPHVSIEYAPKSSPNPEEVVIVLIKASASRYKSRKQRFMEKFQLMQPIYERLIVACAVADQHDQVREYSSAKVKWEEALALCDQYMGIQFEKEGFVVDIDEMKEAFRNGTIGLFVRDVSKLHSTDSETF